MQYIIEDTKTPSGVRFVPMTQEVMDCFRHILENREKLKAEPVVSDAKGRLNMVGHLMPGCETKYID